MKSLRLLIPALVLCFAACKNNDTVEEETVITSTGSAPDTMMIVGEPGSKTTITVAEVPDTVKNVFMAKYPSVKTEAVQWSRYVPDTIDAWPTDLTYYYVFFPYNGADMSAWYNERGERIKTSEKIKGDPRLPDAVNKTINAQYPGYTIEEIEKSNDKDMVMYEVKLEKGEAKAKLKVLPDGTVFKRK